MLVLVAMAANKFATLLVREVRSTILARRGARRAGENPRCRGRSYDVLTAVGTRGITGSVVSVTLLAFLMDRSQPSSSSESTLFWRISLITALASVIA